MKLISTKPFTTKMALRAACAMLFLSSCSVLLPVSATGKKVGGTKTGTATATSVFGLWINQDASIRAAATNGGITNISTVDKKVTTYFWIFTTVETIVVGD